MDPNIGKTIEYIISILNEVVAILTWLLMLIYGNPFVMFGWFIAAMYSIKRQHKIREKSSIFYYLLLLFDGIGLVADVMANYSWASILMLDPPGIPFRRNKDKRWEIYMLREITVSKHMERINDSWVDNPDPSTREKWAHLVSSSVCKILNRFDPSGHHC